MNNLDRDIEVGEIVITKGNDTPFVCLSGNGMKMYHRSDIIIGYYLNETRNVQIHGYNIDRMATDNYQIKNSKFIY